MSADIDVRRTDFMVIATGAGTVADALEMTAGVYAAAGALMSEAGKLAGVADEGGFWQAFDSNEEALAIPTSPTGAIGKVERIETDVPPSNRADLPNCDYTAMV